MGDFIPLTQLNFSKDNNKQNIIEETYNKCKKQSNLPKEEMINYVKNIYKPFSPEEISKKYLNY